MTVKMDSCFSLLINHDKRLFQTLETAFLQDKENKKQKCGDFPGRPVVKAVCFHCRGGGEEQVQSLLRELRSHHVAK